LYRYTMVLCNLQGVGMEDVLAVLRNRFGTSGVEEKAGRPARSAKAKNPAAAAAEAAIMGAAAAAAAPAAAPAAAAAMDADASDPVGLYKLNSVNPELESAWFQPL
jgi:hypothetical protein